MAISLPSIKIVLRGTTEPLDIQVTDNDGNAVDADLLQLRILDSGGSILFQDDISVLGTKIIKAPDTIGYYYYIFGEPLDDGISPSANIGEGLAQWIVKGQGATLSETVTQNIKVISPVAMYNLPYLRLMIDKSRKAVDTANDVFLGYSDAQLVMFMESGLQIINGYQPQTVAGFTIDNFPWRDFRHVANECALMSGVLSQQLFAIDTDLPNYSDQGVTFVIAHQPQLASVLNQISQRLDRAIPAMKLQFVSSGAIHINQGPNARLAQLLQAAPSGALFRNMFFRE